MIEKSLKLYNFIDPEVRLIRHNENMTYQVKSNKETYMMRVHKPVDGFSLGILRDTKNAYQYINGEIEILKYLSKNTNIGIQTPVANVAGEYITLIDDTPVTVLKWVEGETLDKITCTTDIGYQVGKMTAKLNRALSLVKRDKLVRYRYDKRLIKRMAEQVTDAEHQKQILPSQMIYIQDALLEIITRMELINQNADNISLVHTDLSKSNMVFTGKSIIPIDFSLSGYCYYYMDIASLLSHFINIETQKEIIAGYESERLNKINLYYVEPFYAMQVLLFITCQHNKCAKEEWFPKAVDRWCHTIFIPLTNKQNFLL